MISEAGQLELVEANARNLGYRATPILPELGGKACEKTPRSDLRRSRLDPFSSPPEVVVAPPNELRHLAESSLLLRGLRRENNEVVDGVRLALLPPCKMFPCPLSLFRLFPTPISSRYGRPYPPPVVYVVRGAPLRAVCRYDNPRHTA
jgi:hypothetical protein